MISFYQVFSRLFCLNHLQYCTVTYIIFLIKTHQEIKKNFRYRPQCPISYCRLVSNCSVVQKYHITPFFVNNMNANVHERLASGKYVLKKCSWINFFLDFKYQNKNQFPVFLKQIKNNVGVRGDPYS